MFLFFDCLVMIFFLVYSSVFFVPNKYSCYSWNIIHNIHSMTNYPWFRIVEMNEWNMKLWIRFILFQIVSQTFFLNFSCSVFSIQNVSEDDYVYLNLFYFVTLIWILFQCQRIDLLMIGNIIIISSSNHVRIYIDSNQIKLNFFPSIELFYWITFSDFHHQHHPLMSKYQ